MILLFLLGLGLVLLVIYLGLKLIDVIYINVFKRPLWVHFYWYKKRLNKKQQQILKEKFTFYNKLSSLNKKRFEHRVIRFVGDKEFIAREGLILDDEKKLLIAATAVMLTFGMRDYLIPIIEKVIVYPDVFYSTINQEDHKGEFNPMLRALVLSWKDFEEGFRIDDDNLNLGIHEITHAIHINSIKRTDTASVIFSDGFYELQQLLLNENVKTRIMESSYFRDYAFTNKFEFLAVVLENFIESPDEFKGQFPLVYKKIRQMFNFRFAGY
ncbi:zinc-dependent peptidase [Pseudofulvibacter geojedonensis]